MSANSTKIWLLLFLFIPLISSPLLAGTLDPAGPPDSSSTRMYSLQQIYDLVNSGREPVLASSFASPSSGPGSTMRTLNEVCDILKSKFSACTAGAGDVLAGKYFFATELTTGGTGAWGATRGTIPNRGNGGTITPGTTDQTIASGFWRTGHTVLGDADLLPVNIRSGVTIFGAAGTLSPPTGDAAITDVLAGKTFSNSGGTGLVGTLVPPSGGLLKTGQFATYHDASPPYDLGDDGVLRAGTAFDYTDNGDNTVTDNVTGLMWIADHTAIGIVGGYDWTLGGANHGRFIWDNDWGTDPDAFSAIAALNAADYAGYDDWRLPNRRELESLVDASVFNPSLDTAYFPNTQTACYWSSTTHADETGYAWGVYFYGGNVTRDDKDALDCVRPVRGGL